MALKIDQPSSKAEVVDLQVHRTLAFVAEARRERAASGFDEQAFRNQIDVADIAVMLSGILDDGQRYRLITMIRNVARDATLDTLADALEAI